MATDVHIGGRLEAVAPRRVTDTADRVRLLVLVGVAVAVHAWVLTHTRVTARDSIGFARYALQLEYPRAGGCADVVDVLKPPHNQHPPGYPLAILAASWPVRAAYHADLPDQMLMSAQVASCVAAVLLVFPTYWLGRMLFGKFAGFAAALLFQVLPVPAEVTSDGLTEGVYLLALGTALLLGTRAVKNPGVGGFLLCGLATGVTYLVRPEGLLAAAAVGLVAVGMVLARRWPLTAAAGWLTALAVGVILPALPYMVLIGGVTSKTAGTELFKVFGNPREMLHKPANGALPGAAAPLFAVWYNPETDGPLPAWVPRAIAAEAVKTFHYVPAGLAVLGLLASARRLRAEPWVWVPIVFGGLVLAAVAAMATVGQVTQGERHHYVSERHTLPLVYVGCFFAAFALERLPGWLGRISLVGDWPAHPAVAWAVLAAIVVSCVPKLVKPLHAERAGHVAAGKFLADNMNPEDTLIDPFEWAGFYSGRALRSIPPDPKPVAGRYRWAVLESGDTPHSHLHRLRDALNVANDGKNKATVEFQWAEKSKVVTVYRQRITEEDEAAAKAGQGK
jgi:hypothetical protein